STEKVKNQKGRQKRNRPQNLMKNQLKLQNLKRKKRSRNHRLLMLQGHRLQLRKKFLTKKKWTLHRFPVQEETEESPKQMRKRLQYLPWELPEQADPEHKRPLSFQCFVENCQRVWFQ